MSSMMRSISMRDQYIEGTSVCLWLFAVGLADGREPNAECLFFRASFSGFVG
jgi:hypothetical protein